FRKPYLYCPGLPVYSALQASWITVFSLYSKPHRFPTRKQVIRFCQLGVCKYIRDGKPVGREHLNKAGHSRLKQVSYIGWETSQGSENEGHRFYQPPLQRSDNATNP